MTDNADAQASLEAVLKDEIIRMYQDVAEKPEAEYHFFHGREAAELFGYDSGLLDRAPAGAVASFAGVGNPHLRSAIQPGETVVDLGSGAGLDSIIAAWHTGPDGKVIGVDLNPAMCLKAQAHAEASGTRMECHQGRMENIPLADASADVVISNGVINLSFQKRKVVQDIFRVLKPGGRLAVSDIVVRGEVPSGVRRSVELWMGCVAGALEEQEYIDLLAEAGFETISLEPTRIYHATDARAFLEGADLDLDPEAVDGRFMSAFVRATRPRT